MGRVTFQEFRLADLHTMSATARHGSDTLGFKDTRTHATEDQTHRLRPSRCSDHLETNPVDDPCSQPSPCKADAKQPEGITEYIKTIGYVLYAMTQSKVVPSSDGRMCRFFAPVYQLVAGSRRRQ